MQETGIWQYAATVAGCILGMTIMEIGIIAKAYVENRKQSKEQDDRGSYRMCYKR